VGLIAELQAARGEAMGFAPNREPIQRKHARVIRALEQLQEDVRNLHQAFLLLSPSMQHEELTLSGARRLEKRVRRALAAAGYSNPETAQRG
jgi:hypothetical protein